MLIEELIRLGRPLLDGGLDPGEVLGLVADVTDPRVRNFYRRVYVVELPAEDGSEPHGLDKQVWGSVGDRDRFEVDAVRAAGAPVAVPGGGNPIHPQGRYPLPAYPIYGAHFGWFRESAAGVERFLRGRLDRTPGVRVTDEELAAVADQLHRRVVADGADEDWLGVLILARPGTLFRLAEDRPGTTTGRVSVGLSRAGAAIVPDMGRILDGVWAARVEEAATGGRRPGTCFVTGAEGEVVAPCCTAWPWAFLTWTCPLPHAGTADLLTEGLGLSEPAYRTLVLGACVFRRLTRLVRPWLLHEVFAPAGDRVGRNAAHRRSLTDLDPIYGTAFLMPVQDATLADPDQLYEFARGMRAQLAVPRAGEPPAARHLDAVTGFDSVLPDDLDRDDYRLTLVYFSGDVGRGDVHLRAYIQDVLPSVAGALTDLADAAADFGRRVLLGTNPRASDEQQAYLRTRLRSVPYLLARAYGGSHLWAQLETAMHRGRLERGRVTANAAARLASLVPNWPDSRFDVNDEVIFYLTALAFVAGHNAGVARHPGDDMPMRPWPELLDAVERGPIEAMNLRPDDPAELGFACGVLLRRFGGWYWHATRVGTRGKDFLEHRVLTFGSDLGPAAVRNGLKQTLELPKRLRDLHTPADFERRVGVVLCDLDNRQAQLRGDRDGFLAAFWAGYALQGANAPSPADAPTPVPAPAEEQQ